MPAGCERGADSFDIVDDEHDTRAADDIPWSRVVVDPALDLAILGAHAELEISSLAIRAVADHIAGAEDRYRVPEVSVASRMHRTQNLL